MIHNRWVAKCFLRCRHGLFFNIIKVGLYSEIPTFNVFSLSSPLFEYYNRISRLNKGWAALLCDVGSSYCSRRVKRRILLTLRDISRNHVLLGGKRGRYCVDRQKVNVCLIDPARHVLAMWDPSDVLLRADASFSSGRGQICRRYEILL